MDNWTRNIDSLISSILTELNIDSIEKHICDKKIEYVYMKGEMGISISYTLDKAYDFMVVDANSEKIVYSNTEFGVEPFALRELINRDVVKTKMDKNTKEDQNSNENCATGLLALVPKNKFDDRNLDKLNALSDSEIQVIMKDLLEWTKDINWPIALPIIHILSKREKIVIPYLKEVFKSQDWEWETWILKYLVSGFTDESINKIKKELEEIVYMDIVDDDFVELQVLTRELYIKCTQGE